MIVRSAGRFVRLHWYTLSVGLIIVLAILLRFYNYDNRFALAGDQARDGLVAREAIRRATVPPLGPFSSAGNFTTGFIWYTWLIFSTLLSPNQFLTPWVIMSLTYVGIVFLMIVIGYKIGGKLFGFLSGLYTAISPAQIIQSLNITNPSLVALFSALSLLWTVRYVIGGNPVTLFLLGVSIGLAISAHFQAIYLLYLIPVVLLLRKDKITRWIIAVFGLLIPTIPYIVFDMSIGFYNLRGIADYVLFGQNNIYIANRWLTYAFQFLPDLWRKIIGGEPVVGYLFTVLSVICVYAYIRNKKIQTSFAAILIATACAIIMLRYYKGEKYFGYFVFIHPLILIISAWISIQLLHIQKILGVIFITAVVFTSLYTDVQAINGAVNITYDQARYWTNVLMRKYPGEKFDLYAGYPINGKAVALVLYLDTLNLTADRGHKIGFGEPPDIGYTQHTLIKENTNSYDLWDLESSASSHLTNNGWYNINPSYIYNETAGWYKTVNSDNGFQKLIELIQSKHLL